MVRTEPMDHDGLSEQVRRFCAERYYELEKTLRPLVDNSFGEVLPGHLAGYIATLRELGRLYQTAKPPRDLQNLIPAAKVAEILAGIEARHLLELEAMRLETEERVRMETSAGASISIQAAQSTVLTKLLELEKRG